jgi:hypothetical protein
MSDKQQTMKKTISPAFLDNILKTPAASSPSPQLYRRKLLGKYYSLEVE